MKKIFQILLSAITISCAIGIQSCNNTNNSDIVLSPDKNIKLNFNLSDIGQPRYSVYYNDKQIIDTSCLGVITQFEDFSINMKIISISNSTITDQYKLFSGKKENCNYNANESVYTLKNKKGKIITITFQVSNNGVAFRYGFPEKDSSVYIVENETTEFTFNKGAKAWLQPIDEVNTGFAATNPSYERHYLQDIPVGTECPTKAGWAFPSLFKSNGVWALISETGLEASHCGSRLKNSTNNGTYKIGFPMKEETFTNGALLSNSTLPWNLPWRIIALGDKLADIVESTLGTDLAKPSLVKDTEWIVPGKSSWSWVLLKDDFTTYPVQKEFIDYAAGMGWEYCLIDAFWDQKIGYEKTAELAAYAKTKNVGVLVWYNSAGDWNTTPMTPKDILTTKDKRRAEFKLLQEMGIKGIKVDFFGGDGQSMIAYYHDILKDAADFQLLVNFHGSTLPRGIQRTYPHNLTNESIRGYEFTTFFQADMNKLCNHASMLPFTRNCFDPMDFTPMCFGEVPNIKRTSTNGFELATAIVFVSGIQHYAETAKGMQKVPEYVRDFIKDIPSIWEDVKFIDGYPGKHVVIARKAGNQWYVAGINGENTDKDLTLNLSKLGSFKEIEIITDGEDNRSFKQLDKSTDELHNLEMQLKANGGFVIRLTN